MTDRSQPKPFEQDVLGILFCALGGFVAVSIVLAWMGQEPRGDLWSLPIQSLVAALGPFAALLLSVGIAVLGTMLFLRSTSMPSLRLLLGLVAAAVGLSLLAGILGQGGGLGHVFPELLPGGKVLGGVLGLAVLWLGLVLASPGPRRASGAAVVQRVGLKTRTETREASVSAAEAELLTPPAPRTSSLGVVTPLPRAAGAPARKAPAAEPSPRPSSEPSVRPLKPSVPARPVASVAPLEEVEVAASAEAPPVPSWELEESEEPFPGKDAALEETVVIGVVEVEEAEAEDEEEDLEEDEDAELVDEDDSEDEDAYEEEEEEEELEEEELETSAGLEDDGEEDESEEELEYEGEDEDEPEAVTELEEEASEVEEVEEVEEELPVAAQALADAAPSPDEVAPGSRPSRASWEQVGLFDEVEEPAEDPGFTLEPAPRAAREEEPAPGTPAAKDWDRLVHEAGCLFLEENRVAVSMLQRRFSMEFDEACRVLDELQEAGLIGPYMGGRTRDILLTRDEWQALAPRVS